VPAPIFIPKSGDCRVQRMPDGGVEAVQRNSIAIRLPHGRWGKAVKLVLDMSVCPGKTPRAPE
jgi:hypothetical protein